MAESDMSKMTAGLVLDFKGEQVGIPRDVRGVHAFNLVKSCNGQPIAGIKPGLKHIVITGPAGDVFLEPDHYKSAGEFEDSTDFVLSQLVHHEDGKGEVRDPPYDWPKVYTTGALHAATQGRVHNSRVILEYSSSRPTASIPTPAVSKWPGTSVHPAMCLQTSVMNPKTGTVEPPTGPSIKSTPPGTLPSLPTPPCSPVKPIRRPPPPGPSSADKAAMLGRTPPTGPKAAIIQGKLEEMRHSHDAAGVASGSTGVRDLKRSAGSSMDTEASGPLKRKRSVSPPASTEPGTDQFARPPSSGTGINLSTSGSGATPGDSDHHDRHVKPITLEEALAMARTVLQGRPASLPSTHTVTSAPEMQGTTSPGLPAHNTSVIRSQPSLDIAVYYGENEEWWTDPAFAKREPSVLVPPGGIPLRLYLAEGVSAKQKRILRADGYKPIVDPSQASVIVLPVEPGKTAVLASHRQCVQLSEASSHVVVVSYRWLEHSFGQLMCCPVAPYTVSLAEL